MHQKRLDLTFSAPWDSLLGVSICCSAHRDRRPTIGRGRNAAWISGCSALLADLLIHGNAVVSVDRLIDNLWGDTPPETATNALQTYVAQLRKVLEPERQSGAPGRILQTVAPGYLLTVGRDQLDATRFEEMLRRGQELVKLNPAEAAVLLRDALSLWRGVARLWRMSSMPLSRRLRRCAWRTSVFALENRIEAELALGHHPDPAGELEILVRQHPLREGLCGLLMLCPYQSGRQAEASRVYQRTRERLVEELGMEPGPELQQLLEQLHRSRDVRPAAARSG